jgi:hypothetical protein
MANCQTEISEFIKIIDAKLKADEKTRWQFKMKQYADKIEAQKEQVRIAEEKGKREDAYKENQSQRNFELDKFRINAYRDIAIEQAKNQPKTGNYNNTSWK